MPTVKYKSSGTHKYKATERGGRELSIASKICEQLLDKAGFLSNETWTLRVEKLCHCSSESRLIRVISHNHFGIQLRLKVDPNDTHDHIYTLITPDNTNYQKPELFQKLKSIEKSVSRSFRFKKASDMVETQEIIPENVQEIIPENVQEIQERPSFTTLKGILDDFSKLSFILKVIDTLSKKDHYKDKNDWLYEFVKESGFSDHKNRHVALVISYIKNRGYLTDFYTSKCILVGYKLTKLGIRLINGDKSAMEEAEIVKKIEEPKETKETFTNITTDLLISLADKAQIIADTGKRLQSIEFEKEKIKTKIADLNRDLEKLRMEEEELTKSVAKDSTILQKLANL